MADADPSKKYDQAFFLALATKGKDAWNAWRRDPANKDVRVTFAGIDFSEAPRDQINFSGFEFGDCADFSCVCRWRDRPSTARSLAITRRFGNATFGGRPTSQPRPSVSTRNSRCADFR